MQPRGDARLRVCSLGIDVDRAFYSKILGRIKLNGHRAGVALLCCWLALWTLSVIASESDVSPSAPSIVVTGLRLEPAAPPPETLCRLWVTLRNDGSEAASWLHFRLRLNGHVIRTYDEDVFMHSLPPGEEKEIRLFNVWSSETGRSAAAQDRLEVELTLQEASWVEIRAASPETEGEEVWTPLGAVPGLPSSLRRVFGGGG